MTESNASESKSAIAQIVELSEKHGFEKNLAETVAKAKQLREDFEIILWGGINDLAQFPMTEKELSCYTEKKFNELNQNDYDFFKNQISGGF